MAKIIFATGNEAKTLHRLLEIGKIKDELGVEDIDQEIAPIDADVIIIDECHRSIYGDWQQVLTYFNKAKIDNYLRITVGTDEDMQTLVDIIKTIV